MRSKTIAALTLPVLGLFAAVAPAQEYGTIKGRVVWAGVELPELPPKVKQGDSSVKNAEVCATHEVPDESIVVDPATKGVANCVVYLVRPKGENPEAVKAMVEAHPTVEIDQKGCQFVPHVIAAYQDQEVVFKSSDPIGHNIRLQGFSNPAMNVMLQPEGDLKKGFKSERRPIPLSCDIHPWMAGYLAVFDHPFFAVTDAEGNFEIPGVPAGEQNLVVWQEKAGYVTPGLARGFAVPVQAGKETKVGPIELKPEQLK